MAKCAKKFTVVIDGRTRATVCQFLAANREGLGAATRRKILALKPGEIYREGGGARASWSVRRVRTQRKA